MHCKRGLDIIWVDASHLEEDCSQNKSNSDVDSVALRKEAWEQIRCCDGVVVPGGFGNRYAHFCCSLMVSPGK
jgi:CTP synthase